MNRHISKSQRQGFIILMICSAIMLDIGIYMFVADFNVSLVFVGIVNVILNIKLVISLLLGR